MERSIEAYRTRIYQVVFGLAFVCIAAFSVKSLALGAVSASKRIGVMAVLIGIVLGLDRRYWILCPAFAALGVAIPGLPFDSMEAGCLALIGVHLVRVALHVAPPIRLHVHFLICIPMFLWMAIIGATHPVGLNMFGSTTIGGRFYFKVALGFVTLLFLSNFRFREQDAHLLFRILIIGFIIVAPLRFLSPYMATDMAEEIPNATTHYRFLFALPIYFLLFSRYSLKEILSSAQKFALAVFCSLCILYSGKRSASATLALLPFFRTFILREQRRFTLGMAALVLVILSFFVALDGHGFRLPLSVRRPLAIVFPKYRNNRAGFEGFHDTFRETMRHEAMAIIRENPLFGRNGYRMNREETLWTIQGRTGGQYGGHLLAGAWHSAIFSYPADFGIPCLFFWLAFFAYALVVSIKLARASPAGSYHSACSMFYTLHLLHMAIFAYTSGHSSKTTFELCINYGMVLALWNGLDPDPDLAQNKRMTDSALLLSYARLKEIQ